ncbi:MAG: hypothetical protein K0Q53_82 [Massilibacillus sp.]|jgi:hypothetical protein|nr:hypothetical protein [Massilibacillus sp.]
MQLSYGMNMNPAIAGTLYDISPRTIDSYVAEGTIGLGFGLIVGTDPQVQAKVPAATFSTGFKGIALNQAKEQAADGTVTYVTKDTVPVLRKGRAWVPFISGQAITAETAAYLVFSGADAGKWTNAAGASTTAVAVTDAKFITSNTSTTGGIVAVELS